MKNCDAKDFLKGLYEDTVVMVFNECIYIFSISCRDLDGNYNLQILRLEGKDDPCLVVYEGKNKDLGKCIEDFQDKPVFDGKTFWEAESDMFWDNQPAFPEG